MTIMTRKRRRRRRHSTAWWRRHIGGMPVWASLTAGVVALAVFATVIALNLGKVDAASTPAPTQPSPTATPTPTVEPVTPRADLAVVRGIIASSDPLVVSVLGDSTGNDSDEWVALWAQHLADQGATVTVHLWDPAVASYTRTLTYGDGDRTITIWNGALPGQAAEVLLPILAELQPEEPAVTMFNFGHNRGQVSTGTAIRQALEAADAHWGKQLPVVAVLQNPALDAQTAASDAGRASVQEWATTYSVPTLDVYSAFGANPTWQTDYMLDAVHPNPAGSAVWAQTVIDAIG